MTSPEVFVLCLALVCSIFGTASEQVADHGSNCTHASLNRKFIYDEIDDTDLNMETFRTNVNNHRLTDTVRLGTEVDNDELTVTFNNNRNEGFYKSSLIVKNLDVHRLRRNLLKFNERRNMRQYDFKDSSKGNMIRRVKREEEDPRCEIFSEYTYSPDRPIISHPHGKNASNNYYYSNIDCPLLLRAQEGSVIQLTFIDMFHIEDHPECAYDYLEIRDGMYGYARLLGKLCGEAFPPQITTSGPNAWLKFHSDDTIEYEGFHINVEHIPSASSHSIPDTCVKNLTGMYGVIDATTIDPDCITRSANQALDVLWNIVTPENTRIYLNFTTYSLAKPNECEDNVVQVFGSVMEFDAKLAHYCGSMANAVSTKGPESGKAGISDKGNEMHVRLYASKAAKASTFNATFTAYRTLDPNKDEKCTESEFDCEDNTCIALELKCNLYANCRLKADEDYELCKGETESMISKPHIMVILVIFSLILSSMSFVFLFKCIRKLYQDHKIIKEHIKQLSEDRLDNLISSRLTLDAKRLERDSEPRASLERENHTNEMFKQQRSLSQHKSSSIESDFIQETHIDLDDEPWRREVESITIETEDVKIERNGRTRRSDMSKKEESIRSKNKESEENKTKREIRDVSVGAPDTKESGCQTRESLFQTGTAPSSDGTESGTNSRGFSTFGYSGATLARPSPPAPTTKTSEITIELLRQVPHQDSVKTQKKIPDRRPMSTETTRSAPDVIIVSKPIR